MKTNKRTITLMLLLIIGLSGVSAQSKKEQKEQECNSSTGKRLRQCRL